MGVDDDFSDDERDFGEEQGGSEGMQDDAERMRERMSDSGGEGDMGDMGDQPQDAMDEFGSQGGEDDQSDEYDR